MQDFNRPGQQPGAFGGPPPPARKGLSKGCLAGVIAAAVLAVGTIILIALGVGGAFWLSRKAQEAARESGVSTPGSGTTAGSRSSDAAVEEPSPTEAQAAAIAGGQNVLWEQQEISWTVPQRWKEHSAESRNLVWRSAGAADAASLIVFVSPVNADFPTEVSLNSYYQAAQARKRNAEVDEVRWLKLDGLKGYMFRESAPEKDDDQRRLQWMAYRTYKGQPQLVNIMLTARGRDFARHEDALYAVLYSTKLTK